MESLCVRFHYRGKLEYDGNDWQHIGGRSSCSIVPVSKLSLAELKRHLSDHVSISDEDLQATRLSWRLIERKRNCNFLCSLDDNTTVTSMARHVTRVADGYVDIYARMPDSATFDSSEEENVVDHQENDRERHQVEHQVDHEHHQLEHQTVASSEMFIEAENAEQRRSMKLTVVRAPIQDKGKENVKPSAHEGEDGGESSDSDYDAVHEVDSADSSADDDEAICYRQQALELKNRVKRKMLGEDEVKTTNVPEEFVVPENAELEQDDGSECFDSEDELSYDEDSDGEGNVRTRRTKHRVYDERADVKEFELGQAFHDSREFKQAVVNYGLKNSHHLLFPKDERNRVSAKCSWPTCKWRIYGSIVPNRSQWFTVVVYNNVHTCLPIRNNRLVTSTVIAEKYFREIKDNPGWRIEKMREAVLEDLLADVSASKCKRAKKLVMERIVDYIAPCYRIDVYDQVYSHVLEPVEGKESWPVATNPRPFPPVKMKMPGRPKTERRREEQEKPKGNKLSRKGCIQRCSMCGSEDHNKRKCNGNPDVVTEHAQQKKAAKRSKKKRDEEAAQEATSSAQQKHDQQQEKHVLYVEKKRPFVPPKKKQAPGHAQQQAPVLVQPRQQPRLFVPPKKKQKKSYESSSEPIVGASQSSASLQIPRTQTIPMSKVVTESVPKHGRMKWYLWGNGERHGEE